MNTMTRSTRDSGDAEAAEAAEASGLADPRDGESLLGVPATPGVPLDLAVGLGVGDGNVNRVGVADPEDCTPATASGEATGKPSARAAGELPSPRLLPGVRGELRWARRLMDRPAEEARR